MNKIILSLLLSLSISSLAETTQTVDKYTGIVSTQSDIITLSNSRSVKLTKVEDKSNKALAAVVLTYMKDGTYEYAPKSTTLEFVSDKRGYLMIDDKPVLLGEAIYKHDLHRVSGGFHVNENLGYILKPEVLNQLSTATKIEGRVGSKTEFTFNPAQVETIKEFAINSL